MREGGNMPNQEETNLDLLGALHIIMGILTALFACIPIIHLVIGIVMLTSDINGGEQAPRAIAFAFIVLASLIILVGWVLAFLIIMAGINLKKRKSYQFCTIMAFVECLIMPLGTVLGIFTIITLSKEPVKKLFS
jgi:hypothetical protein